MKKKRTGNVPRQSNFWLTINTNKKPEDFELRKEIVKDFERAMDILLTRQGLSEVMNFKEYASDLNDRSIYPQVEVVTVTEIGPVTHSIHSHTVIRINPHYGWLQLDSNKINEFMKAQLGWDTNLHVDFKLLGGSNDDARLNSYVLKDKVNAPQLMDRGPARLIPVLSL